MADGLLDPVWAAAPVSEGFLERKPAQGAEPPVATRFRAGYDSSALWLFVECDDVPGGVTARTRTRDSFEMFSDDAISAKVDALTDRRTTLGFATNPLGAQLDYRAVQDGDFRVEVDAVWTVAVSRRDDGWTAEFRIPWVALGLDGAALPPSLGFNWSRDHARRNATYDWSLMPRPFSAMSASLYGTLRLVGVVRGDATGGAPSTLAVTPFATLGLREEEGFANAGADAQLGVGATQLSVSVNTDFAQADVDDQVVQLDRFGLFIPEKREFFLAHAESFAVARSGVLQPVHTRRIGLSSGDPAAMLGGVALATRARGDTGPEVRITALQATTRPTPEGDPWTSSAIARVEVVGAESAQWSAGLIATHRQGEAADDANAVIGLDGSYRGPAPWLVRAALMGSFTGAGAPAPGVAVGGKGRQALDFAPALHLRVSGRDPVVQPVLDYAFVHEDFRADLGFVERANVHDTSLSVNVEQRLERAGLEKFTVTVAGGAVADGAAESLLDWETRLDLALTWDSGTWLALGGGYGSDTVEGAFSVGPRDIAAGRYEGPFASLTLSSPPTLALYGSLTADARAYFGGWLAGGSASATWKPLDRVRLEATCDARRALFEEGGGDFTTVLVNGRVALGFTTWVGLDLFVGYGLLAEALRSQARLRLTLRPGSDLFVVYGADVSTGAEPALESQSFLVKLALRVDAW